MIFVALFCQFLPIIQYPSFKCGHQNWMQYSNSASAVQKDKITSLPPTSCSLFMCSRIAHPVLWQDCFGNSKCWVAGPIWTPSNPFQIHCFLGQSPSFCRFGLHSLSLEILFYLWQYSNTFCLNDRNLVSHYCPHHYLPLQRHTLCVIWKR